MIALAVTCVVLAAAVVLLVLLQGIERSRWATERRQLVDRIIAKHGGDVIALDRAAKPRQQPEPAVERPVAVGL